jgi:hypothetical protein
MIPRYAFPMFTAIMLRKIMSGKISRNILLILVATGSCAAQQRATAPVSEEDSLLLLASGHSPLHLAATDLKAMPHITVTFHNSHTNADEAYAGVRLADLLSKMGAPLGSELRGKALAEYVVATGSDGYQAVLALAEIDPSFHPGDVLVADSMDGKPLDAHAGPFKLVVTEDKRPARCVRNLVSIELKTAQ